MKEFKHLKERPSLSTNNIYYVDAPPGAGKTYAMCEYAAGNRHQSNHLIVQPTDVVARETEELLRKEFKADPLVINVHVLEDSERLESLIQGMEKLGIDADQIQNLIRSGKINPIIVACSKKAKECGTIMIITHAALLRNEYFHRPENWDMYFDEVVQIDTYHEIDVRLNVDVIKSRVQPRGGNDFEGLVQLEPKNPTLLRKELDNPDHILRSYDNKLIKFLRDVYDPHQEVFMKASVWEGLENQGRLLTAVSMTSAAKFRTKFSNVILLSANVKETMMYRWFEERFIIRFKDHAMNNKLQFNDLCHLKSRVRIHYLIKGHTGYGSKALSMKCQSIIDEQAMKFIGEREFAYSLNNFYVGVLLKESDNCIPVNAQGLNRYSQHDTYFHNLTQNRNSTHLSLLEMLGLPQEFVTDSTVVESAFQSAMRSNLRCKESDKVVNLIVHGDKTAEKLALKFGVDPSSINYIGGKELNFIHNNKYIEKCTKTLKNTIRGKVHYNNDKIPPQGHTYCVGIHRSIDKYDQLIVEKKSHLEIFKFFEDFSKEYYFSKKDVLMFNPCIFTEDGPKTYKGIRCNSQMVQANFIVLDIDGGNLTWNECADLFWKEAGRGKKRSFIICNTFSNSPKYPNRYRLIFPLKSPIMSPEHYKQVAQTLASRIPEEANVDKCSFVAVQDYYLPCTNAEFINNSKYTFFKKFGHKSHVFFRCAVDPNSEEYRYRPPVKLHQNDNVRSIKRKSYTLDKNVLISRSVAEYRNIPVGEGRRNDGLNKLAIQLFDHVSLEELERILLYAVGNDQKMIDRLPGQIARVYAFKKAG